MTARSYLYVPGNAPRMFAKASDRGADALIFDLEDAVPPAAKASSRNLVSAWLQERGPDVTPPAWVRVNPIRGLMEDDIATVVHPGLAGLYVPKAEDPDTLEEIAAFLDDLEKERATSSILLAPIIESAAGLQAVSELAAARRVSHLAMGEADLAADLGISASEDEREWISIRIQVVIASAAAGIQPPSGAARIDIADLDGLRTSSERLYRLGFRARSAVHPSQVPVINDVFTPSRAEVAAARRVVELYEDALSHESGVVLDDRGRMIDEAVVRSAREVLTRAERISADSSNPQAERLASTESVNT
ncbi:MAG: CoA ester lyase [Actinobacteria bacterium]|nr:CoA ester lyase [Actinomycetota bacterium]